MDREQADSSGAGGGWRDRAKKEKNSWTQTTV